jgi:ATP-dependent helicase/nuclease subunit A
MSAKSKDKGPVDEADRRAATTERARNVLIDAGAGTGKTTLVVARFLELLAPSDGSPGLPVHRLAAVTFTRRAAGELRLRIREGLLRTISEPKTSESRRALLRAALGGLDAAWIGTIHSFADRLLRLEPMASRLSPTYDLVEDADELCLETWHALLEASEAGKLHEVLAGQVDAARAMEAQLTLLNAIEVGIAAETIHYEFNDVWGLEALVAGFINRRDSPPAADPPIPPPDFKAFRAVVDEFAGLTEDIGDESAPQRFLTRAAGRLALLRAEKDPVTVFRSLRELVASAPKTAGMRADFAGDKPGWAAWKAWCQELKSGKGDDAPLIPPILFRLQRPFIRWMAVRLVRTFPVVVAMYERVKARHQVLDQIDLLLVLRNVLRDQPEVRARYQSLFDHIFVDEFQDTDPLQAEILMFLCEAGSGAKTWDQVKLKPGQLTLVGDPKQSIYRFRRADVQMYDSVRQLVMAGPHLSAQLRANFRSVLALIEWFNHRFEEVLGSPGKAGQQFDADTGEVFHAPLAGGLTAKVETPVWHVRFSAEDDKVGPMRHMEASAWARAFKWLVEVEKPQVRDPLSGEWRPVRYGDIAVLAHVTTNLSMLLEAFDHQGVPWSARGGQLFLDDPLHRQFLLGLRALADRDDGVAMMALMRPPFFAVDLADVALEKSDEAPPELLERMAGVRALITELRRRRFDRTPGDTARDLLELTGFGRHIALGPNGAQRLERLRELCFLLDRTALEGGLDYDAATAQLREWVNDPPKLDAPHPVASEVVQVLTIYQAKGLEFPVVALWDSQARWTPQRDGAAWVVSRDGTEWAIALNAFKWSEPESSNYAEREFEYAGAEKRRVVYVAATRARDLLLVPVAGEGGAPDRFITDMLAAAEPPDTVRKLEPWEEGKPPPEWAEDEGGVAFEVLPAAGSLAARLEEYWHDVAQSASEGLASPVAVSQEAIRVVEAARAEDEDEVSEPPEKVRSGRYGREFGSTVHRAIALALLDEKLSVAEAVARAAHEWGLNRNLDAAVADVERALAALRTLGVVPGDRDGFAVEYPVAMPREGKLLNGSIDLVATKGGLTVIDFKTDAAPRGDVEAALPAYAEQVRRYASILEHGGLAAAGTVKTALLFTETGSVAWISR